MKYFKQGQKGWFMGCRFTVIGRQHFAPEMIYQVRFDRAKKFEYFSHSFLKAEKCFYFDAKTGEYIGPHHAKEQLQ